MHPAGRRCSSLSYTRYARSSRLAGRAPRRPHLPTLFFRGPLEILLRSVRSPRFSLLGVDARRLVAGTLDVLDIGTLVGVRLCLGAALSTQLQHPIAQATQELPVVRHEQHRAVEVLQRIEEHFL